LATKKKVANNARPVDKMLWHRFSLKKLYQRHNFEGATTFSQMSIRQVTFGPKLLRSLTTDDAKATPHVTVGQVSFGQLTFGQMSQSQREQLSFLPLL